MSHFDTWAHACIVLGGTLPRAGRAFEGPRPGSCSPGRAARCRGVSYHKRKRLFEASLQVRDRPGYIGSFKTAKQAVEARDQAVRSLYPHATPDHKFHRKRKLNFPSEEEAAYNETPQQARKRALSRHCANTRKADRSMEMLQKALNASPYSDKY
eukprot:s4568_g8.t1